MKYIYSHFLLLFTLLCLASSCSVPDSEQQSDSSATNNAQTEEKTLPSSVDNSNENPIEKSDSTEEKIAAIRTLYTDIQDNIEKFEVKTKAYSGEIEAVVSGELTAYSKEGQIVKLVDDAEGDHGPGRNEFYFVNGNLFFLFSQISTIEMRENPDSHIRELRLYFDEKGQIIDALFKTHTVKHGEAVDMSTVANEKGTNLIGSVEEAEYYAELASETLEFFQSEASFDEFYGEE